MAGKIRPSIILLSAGLVTTILCGWGCSDRDLSILSAEIQPTDIVQDDSRYMNNFCLHTDPNPPECTEPVVPAFVHKGSVIRILGFDAVGWRILNSLLDELPNINRLICEGSTAIFVTDWGFSPVSWTTIATGKTMEKHGILTDPAWGKSAFKYANDAVQTARIWDILRYHKLNMNIGNYFFIDSGMKRNLTPGEECQEALNLIVTKPDDHLITLLEFTDLQFHMSLMPFAMKHTAWSNSLHITPASRAWVDFHAAEVVRVLKEMDRLIGDVLTKFPQDTLLVVSDHGASVKNPWIQISIDPKVVFPDGEVSGAEHNETVTFGSGIKIRLESIPRYFKVAGSEQKDYLLKVYAVRLTIDPPTNPQPEAVVALEKSLELLSTEGLKVFKKSDTGFELNPVFLEKVIMNGCGDPALRVVHQVGSHDAGDRGIFMAYGPNIRSGFRSAPLQLVDFVPTVLYLVGAPVGRDMDGEVAMDIFRPEFTADNPVQFIDSYDPLLKLPSSPGKQRELTPEERMKYRKVGYPGLE